MEKNKTNKSANTRGHGASKTKELKHLQQMELLLSVSKQMAAIETLNEMLKAIVDITTTETNSERGTLFLNDEQTGELYSRVALGSEQREIRILNNSGIAGYVFNSGKGLIIPDAYADERFERSIDKQTGFITRNTFVLQSRRLKDTSLEFYKP